jgi:hypothetical protein
MILLIKTLSGGSNTRVSHGVAMKKRGLAGTFLKGRECLRGYSPVLLKQNGLPPMRPGQRREEKQATLRPRALSEFFFPAAGCTEP